MPTRGPPAVRRTLRAERANPAQRGVFVRTLALISSRLPQRALFYQPLRFCVVQLDEENFFPLPSGPVWKIPQSLLGLVQSRYGPQAAVSGSMRVACSAASSTSRLKNWPVGSRRSSHDSRSRTHVPTTRHDKTPNRCLSKDIGFDPCLFLGWPSWTVIWPASAAWVTQTPH